MTSIAPVVTLSPRDADAVLFALDGVLTRTASVHAAAWKRLCDGFLAQRAADTGAAFVAFDIDADDRRYVIPHAVDDSEGHQIFVNAIQDRPPKSRWRGSRSSSDG